MIEFVLAVCGLFDDTLTALLGVPIFNFFICGFLVLLGLSLYWMLSSAAAGRRRK